MRKNIIRVKIPLERVGVLIGSEGHIKETIEKKFNLNLSIDSQDGNVSIVGSTSDPSLLFRARDIVLAIGRGFSPEKAFLLFLEDLNLYIIDLRELFESSSDIQRVKSRVIGRNGKTRHIIEEETKTNISIYGYTISIIGDLEHLSIAREAIDMLIRGVLHRNVYRFLDMKRRDLKQTEMELWKSKPKSLREGKKKNV